MTATAEELKAWDRWFNKVRRQFARLAWPYANKPTVYVEIGCWAGASACWTARNILRHPQAMGIGIDPYANDNARTYDTEKIKETSRTRLLLMGKRWHWIYQPSALALQTIDSVLKGRAIDLLYIDGDHSMQGVFTDFILSWPHLRPGSTVIFDDYGLDRGRPMHVRHAYHAILRAFDGMVEQVNPIRQQAALRVVHHNLVVGKT